MESPQPPGTELFYCETYEDADQVIKPQLSPRGRRITGPFRSYPAAQQHGIDASCSHFTISKSFLGRAADVPFVEDRPAGN